MLVLAVSDAWVGVVGTIGGGLLVVATTWLVHRVDRKDRLAERARAERNEAYAVLLMRAEDSMHLFEQFAHRDYSGQGLEEARAHAVRYYDKEVTTRYRVLQIIGDPDVTDAAREMRHALSRVRNLVRDEENLVTADSDAFKNAHGNYRVARNRFVRLARGDLGLTEDPDD